MAQGSYASVTRAGATVRCGGWGFLNGGLWCRQMEIEYTPGAFARLMVDPAFGGPGATAPQDDFSAIWCWLATGSGAVVGSGYSSYQTGIATARRLDKRGTIGNAGISGYTDFPYLPDDSTYPSLHTARSYKVSTSTNDWQNAVHCTDFAVAPPPSPPPPLAPPPALPPPSAPSPPSVPYTAADACGTGENVTWLRSASGQSCDDRCAEEGGACDGTVPASAFAAECVAQIYREMFGSECELFTTTYTHQPFTTASYPSGCYYKPSASAFRCDLSQISWLRYCPCSGVPSPPPPGPPSPPSSPPSPASPPAAVMEEGSYAPIERVNVRVRCGWWSANWCVQIEFEYAPDEWARLWMSPNAGTAKRNEFSALWCWLHSCPLF